jgi:hypothetical protein
MPFPTIRKYLAIVTPVLRTWAEHDSLREITPQQVHTAVTELRGNPAKDRATALRSLFRALKHERLIFRDPTRGLRQPTPTGQRLIFRDPTRGLRQPTPTGLPQPLPTDRLHGLLDRTSGPMAKLTVALVAIHALTPAALRRALLVDLDPTRGRMTVRLITGPHTLYLHELTHALALDWLRERQRRWPATTNPHLLLTQQTASMPTGPPVSTTAVYAIFNTAGIHATQLRRDRILDEARATADPVHLMRVFGIAVETAMRYVYAAHPERRSTGPR